MRQLTCKQQQGPWPAATAGGPRRAVTRCRAASGWLGGAACCRYLLYLPGPPEMSTNFITVKQEKEAGKQSARSQNEAGKAGCACGASVAPAVPRGHTPQHPYPHLNSSVDNHKRMPDHYQAIRFRNESREGRVRHSPLALPMRCSATTQSPGRHRRMSLAASSAACGWNGISAEEKH